MAQHSEPPDQDDQLDMTLAGTVVGGGGAVRDEKCHVDVSFYGALGFGGGGTSDMGVSHLADGVLLYSIGKHMAVYNYETLQYRFILKQAKAVEIITFAVAFNKKYIAISERLTDDKDGGNEVSVWTVDLQETGSSLISTKRVRSLPFSYLSKQPVVSLAFSRDNKLLVTVTANPEAFVYLWQLDKSPCRLVTMAETGSKVTQVSFCPWSPAMICTTGGNMLKIWTHHGPNQLRPAEPMLKKKEYRYTSHIWYEHDKLVAATMEGDIIVVEHSECKKVLSTSHTDNQSIWCIVPVNRGFVCAGDGGCISLFERTFDGSYFHIYKSFRTQDMFRIVSLSVSPNEENIICCCNNNTASVFSLSNIDILEPDKELDPEEAFRPLPIGFHSDTITSLSVCIQRSIIVTSSTDKHVRIWNYLRKKTEIDCTFDEEVSAVACHPSGLSLVIAFKYKMAMYTVLASTLHAVQEFPVKHCKELAFSKGGHFFAAAVVTKIFIYNSYNFTCIGFLTGHTSMVRSLTWINNDQHIISAGYEGAIHLWDVETCKNLDLRQNQTKAVAHSCVRFDDISQLLLVVGCNKVADQGQPEGAVCLRTMTFQEKPSHPVLMNPILLGVVQQKQAHSKSHTAECAISTLHKCTFLGSVTGQILVYPWPLSEGDTPLLTVEAHSSAVVFVLLSTHENFLFSVGEDRSLFIFEISSQADGPDAKARGFISQTTFEDVAHVLQKDLDEQISAIKELTEANEDLEMIQNQEKKKLKLKFESLVEQKRKETAKQVEQHYQKSVDCQKEKEKILSEAKERERANETLHLSAAEDLEVLYNSKGEEMEAKYKALKDEKDDMTVRYENKLHSHRKEWAKEKERLKLRLSELEANIKKEMLKLQKEGEEQKQQGEQKLELLEKEYEAEIQEVKDVYQAEKEKKDVQCEKDMLQWNMGQRMQEKNALEIEKLERDLKARTDMLARAKAKNKEHEKANDALRLEIDVRIDTITTSEKKILELKKQTAELEKLRYVLAFKFNELRKEVAPKEEQIRIMDGRMREMEHEIAKISQDRQALIRALAAKEEKINVIHKETAAAKRKLEGKEILIKGLLRELAQLAGTSSPRRLVYGVRSVIEKFQDQQGNTSNNDGKVVHEFHRQRLYIEKQLSSITKQSSRREQNLSQDNQRKTAENSLLVREINELRHEKKAILEKVRIAEAKVEEMKLQNKSFNPVTPAATPLVTTKPRASSAKLSKTAPSILELAKLDSVNIAEVIQQVEQNNQEMARQQAEIVHLREFVNHLLSRAQLDTEHQYPVLPPDAK
eukprot:TRINITY_DN13427_c0_g1_i1.p1 TRINITY_DN13427_c0_g1~~TRINITY_DN13427_c0_g1_i1.p1  ORF type:complete len:1331 (+),score=530.58 TRINITY_DN13427_c0_g1_i1:112-3993(+)